MSMPKKIIDNCMNYVGLLMGDDIGLGLLSMAVCFDFQFNQRSAAQ